MKSCCWKRTWYSSIPIPGYTFYWWSFKSGPWQSHFGHFDLVRYCSLLSLRGTRMSFLRFFRLSVFRTKFNLPTREGTGGGCTVWLVLLFWPLLSNLLDALATVHGFRHSVSEASYFFCLPASVDVVLWPGIRTHPPRFIFPPFELLSGLQGSCQFLCEAPWLSPAPSWRSCSPRIVQHPAMISTIANCTHAVSTYTRGTIAG